MRSLYDRAAIIPGRSCTRSKAPDRFVRAWAESAHGAVITDTEGKSYIDMLCGLGATSLGYLHGWHECSPAPYGVFSIPHRLEVEAAEAVLTHVAPWASSVRFVKTGSEATTAAYMVARAATDRGIVLRGDWSYHGWHPWATEQRGSVFQHNADLNQHLAATMPEHESRIAAVFIEPHRWEPVNVEWLQSVRAFCDRVGALLVFDSMIYGGRWKIGGASEHFGVIPDLECFGKAFGNGQSVAFVVGREALAQHGEIASGTYSGDVTGLQAVCDTLQVYTTDPVIETLWARGTQLQTGLQKLAWESGKFVVEGQPVHQRIRFHEPAATTAYDYRVGDERPLAKAFREGMAARGVLMLPDAINAMYAHTPEQIDRVLGAVAESVKALV
jgi:glutamate-1-semialdehyde 2,1-aminomutase